MVCLNVNVNGSECFKSHESYPFKYAQLPATQQDAHILKSTGRLL